jgi:hypothetical protein
MMKMGARAVLFCATFVLLGGAHAQVSEAERQALIEFYHATGGDDWHVSDGWLGQEGSECQWHGVQCASPGGNHFVLRLMLADNNLSGQLPDSLGDLDGLRTLALGSNDLQGTIPSDLWGLTNLSDLFLRDNQISGQLPAAILGMAEGAPRTHIDLSGNRLDGFEPGNVPQSPGNEIRLNLGGNLIDSLPPLAWRESGAIEILELGDNLLEGPLAFDQTPWPGLARLDLSGNAVTELTGLSDSSLPELHTLNVRDNRLEALPESLTTLEALIDLDASGNQLSGNLPEWFPQLQLARLGLDNNDLSGPIAGVFEAMDLATFPRPGPHGALGLIVHVANNRFEGALPEIDFGAFNSPFEGQSPEFGLDLCFNDIDLPDEDTVAIIDGVHRGRALASCIGHQRFAVDPSISGSWYQPMRSGEGLTQMLLDNGQVLTYWFTYAPPEDGEPTGQQWLFDISAPSDGWIEHRPLWTTSGGRFEHGLGERGRTQRSQTWMRQHRLDTDRLHFFYDYRGPGFCITGACWWDVLTGRHELVRLTELAGTTCDNQSAYQEYSGAWYNPDRAGEGFIVEVLPDDRAVIYWFTYEPNGSGRQAWMLSDASFDEDFGILPIVAPRTEALIAHAPTYQPLGGEFGPDFDPDDVALTEWGTLSMSFKDDGTAIVNWESVHEEYGSGDYPIERLARPMLAECD